MKPILVLITFLSFLSHATAADNTPPEGFRALFDGKSLEGWTENNQPPVHWTVGNGEKTLGAFAKNWENKEKGPIGFQNHKTPLAFRNIFIKPLED